MLPWTTCILMRKKLRRQQLDLSGGFGGEKVGLQFSPYAQAYKFASKRWGKRPEIVPWTSSLSRNTAHKSLSGQVNIASSAGLGVEHGRPSVIRMGPPIRKRFRTGTFQYFRVTHLPAFRIRIRFSRLLQIGEETRLLCTPPRVGRDEWE